MIKAKKDMVKPEQKLPTQPFPSRHEFNEAVAGVAQYNEQFSLGHGLADVFIQLAKRSERAAELMREDNLPQDEAYRLAEREGSITAHLDDKRDMAKSVLDIVNIPTLSTVGLRLSSPRTEVTMISSDGTHQMGAVKLQLENGDKFASFIEQPGENDEIFRSNIIKVVSDMLEEVSDAVADKSEADMVLETLASSEKLVDALTAIGLGDIPTTHKLKTYLEHYKKGDLGEYVLATRIQILREPEEQQFGPSQWQGDATADYLQARWDQVVELLQRAKANPRAHELFRELVSRSRLNLELAKKDLAKRRTEDSHSNYGKGFDGIFNETKSRIDLLADKDS